LKRYDVVSVLGCLEFQTNTAGLTLLFAKTGSASLMGPMGWWLLFAVGVL
jgi:hypothetical protein